MMHGAYNVKSQHKISRNPSSAGRADTCGQTEGHEEAHILFSRLCERASKETTVYLRFHEVVFHSELLSERPANLKLWNAGTVLEHVKIQFNSIQFSLLKCRLNSTSANYKAST